MTREAFLAAVPSGEPCAPQPGDGQDISAREAWSQLHLPFAPRGTTLFCKPLAQPERSLPAPPGREQGWAAISSGG